MTYLSSSQQDQRRFWMATKYSLHKYMFVEVVQASQLAEPIPVRAALVRVASMGFFFNMTVLSAQACWGATCWNDQRVRDAVLAWQAHFAFELVEPITVCMNMPGAHAALIVRQAWASYSFPICTGRSASATGMALARNLLRVTDADSEALGEDFGPETLQAIADFIRRVAGHLPAEQQQAIEHVALLQGMADRMFSASHMKGTLAYDMLFLLRCLLMAGYIKDSNHLAAALSAALPVVLPDPVMAKFFQSVLEEHHTIPSGSTLYRHRLTIHIGFCRWLADQTHTMLLQGVCRWATIDSSPQGVWDWVLTGASTLQTSDLVVCFRDANSLIRLGIADTEESRVEQSRLVARIGPKLLIVQGPEHEAAAISRVCP